MRLVTRSRSLPRGQVRPPAQRARVGPASRRRILLILLAPLAILLAGGYLWLRDSSLVAVKRVVVQVDPGPDAGHIRQALTRAARNMTTLDVRADQLRMAVAPYPVVKDLRISTHFPHGLRIQVVEHVPVGAVNAGGRPVAVAGDGTLLHDVPARSLPTIPVQVPPGGSRVSDPNAFGAVEVLAAAPVAMLGHITQVSRSGGDGWVAQLRSGPTLRFGEATQLRAKWSAATAVLADPGSAGAIYIDLTDPARPAAGAGTAATGPAASAAGASTPAGASPAAAANPATPGASATTGG